VTPDKAMFKRKKVPYGASSSKHFVGVEFFFSAELEAGVTKYWLKDVDASAPNNLKFPERHTLPRCLTLTRHNVVEKSGDST